MAEKKVRASEKHAIIDKANARMVITISIAVFVVIFCLFAVRSLISQARYQERVISENKSTLNVLRANEQAVEDLRETYDAFASEPINLIGGNPEGEGPQDGDNPKIVLDSLPSEYDYPALSSSIEKLLVDNGYAIESIGGTEDASLSTEGNEEQATSELTEIPYPLSITTSVDGTKNLFDILQRSIRPFYVESVELSGSSESLSVSIQMKTFFKPGVSMEVNTKVVK